ncbi:hypothetical protein Tco_0071464 [Tanacetum coccineum]
MSYREENGVIKNQRNIPEISAAKKIQADYDIKATNIILNRFAVPSNAIKFSGGTNSSATQGLLDSITCQGEGHMLANASRLSDQRNATWYKAKAILAEAPGSWKNWDERATQLAFLADPGSRRFKLFQPTFQIMLLFRLRS